MTALLSAKALIAEAEEETGLSDWGPAPFGDALEQLCQSIAKDGDGSEEKNAVTRAQFLGHLVKRLKIYADRKLYPEIGKQRIAAPIIVTGFPRSGTTILHSLLAVDPRARSPLAWELADPSPPPRDISFGFDPRIARSQAAIDQLPAQFRAMHAMGAELPDEDNSIHQLAFRSLNFAARQSLPTYQDWLLDCDMAPAFSVHRHLLQHLQAFVQRQWWVLKSPPHLFHMPALFDAFPDARIIFTHRDPASIMPSNASLIGFLHEMSGNPVDKVELGRSEVAKWKLGMERAMAFRDSRPDLADRFIDVQYADFIRDQIGVVEQIYDKFGVSGDDESISAMETFLEANRQGKHGKHQYTAEEFGMSADRIRAEFADYMTRYAIPPEEKKK